MKRLILLAFSALSILQLQAKEGMWVPIFLEGALMNDMQLNGFRLTAEDIYSVNKSSLKDAVVRFGGGCTAEVISNDGLLLTNHHCGYSNIQSHSSIDHDYLTDGFWAKTREAELPNPGLTVTFIVRIDDVTSRIMNGYLVEDGLEKANAVLKNNIDAVVKEVTAGGHYEAFVKSIYEGNQYILFITETFKDVRLVGAPPSSIGKYGFDTDNWVWPRHTGDFSMFRVYADANNQPAEYHESNVPLKPRYHLPISLKGYQEGDFTMVYGFPFRTDEYLSSFAVDHLINESTPVKIQIRTKKLEILDRLIREDDVVRIKYAAKQSSTSNAWKKWRGQILGLKKTNALEKKRATEKEMEFKINLYPEQFKMYKGLLLKLEEKYKEMNEVSLARDYFLEVGYSGTDVLRLAYLLDPMVKDVMDKKEINTEKRDALAKRMTAHFKDFDAATDQAVFEAIFPIYLNATSNFYKPNILKEVSEKYKGRYKAWSDELFEKSILLDEKKLTAGLSIDFEKTIKLISKDKLYLLASDLMSFYKTQIDPVYKSMELELGHLNKMYFDALREVFPDNAYYPDANGTLRVTYGKVEGMNAADAVTYKYYTTMDGLMEKYIPESYEFDVPEKLRELYQRKMFDEYGQDGEMRVCFIASNHTSGGNSGSPVLNGNGELIGLNFDRNWEGTMSDIHYDRNLCRNISVDIRYVLFIIDKFADARVLVDEMTIIK